MKYFIGIDGGGTNTKAAICNACGDVLSSVFLSDSNYQYCGIQHTAKILQQARDTLLQLAGLKISDITEVFLALSGADSEYDLNKLNTLAKDVFNSVSSEVSNDIWALHRSALLKPFGAVSVCGTGANSGAVSQNGKRYILRSLSYELGYCGGGRSLSCDALHFMFRADELTYKNTLLVKELPPLFNYSNPSEMVHLLYPKNVLSSSDLSKIPPLVFHLADLGDTVCIELIEKTGRVSAEMLVGVISQAGLNVHSNLPVVLGGSIMNLNNNIFMKVFKKIVTKEFKNVKFINCKTPPVAGALMMALDKHYIEINEDMHRKLAYFEY